MSRKATLALLFAAFYLFVSGWFVANLDVRPELREVAENPTFARGQQITSAFFVIGLALPSFVTLCKWLGAKRGLMILLALGAFALFIETVALNTGLPYGEFRYGPKIGAPLPGGVPWTVSFAWSPLVLGAAFCVQSVARRLEKFAVLGAACLVIFDLVLDPGAVSQEFWSYPNGGAFYGVPASNFAGWMFSGVIGLAMLWKMADLWRQPRPFPRGLLVSTWLILVFWTSVVLWEGLFVPALVGALLWVILGRALFAPATSPSSEPSVPVSS